MDVSHVARVLHGTFSPDNTVRSQAEQQLAQLETALTPGYHALLLQLVTLDDAQCGGAEVKQAALLRLKNNIKSTWDIKLTERGVAALSSQQQQPENAHQAILQMQQQQQQQANSDPASTPKPMIHIHPDDRRIIKDNLAACIVHSCFVVRLRVQLLECLSTILQNDYPTEWPQLTDCLLAGVSQTQNMPLLYASLLMLHRVFKRFQFCATAKRALLEPILNRVMPILLPLAQHMMQSCIKQLQMTAAATAAAPAVASSELAASQEMLRQLIKIFFLSTQMSLPELLRKDAQLSTGAYPQWFTVLLQLLECRVSDAESPLWSAKKWAARTVSRSFQRFGRPQFVKDKALKSFARAFVTQCAPQALQCYFHILRAHHTEQVYCSERVLQLAFSYIETCLSVATLREICLQHRQFLVSDCVLRQLCMTPMEQQQCVDDPHEYIRRQLDVMEEFHDPKLASINLLISLIKYDESQATNDTMQLCMALVQHVFQQYAADVRPLEQRDGVLKDGAMRMLASLAKRLCATKELQHSSELLLIAHVCQEMQSPHSYLRARACHLMGAFSKLKWSNNQAHLHSIQLLGTCLQDSQLVVRLEACTAISDIVRHESVLELLVPSIPLILEQYFLLLDEVGSEEIISRLAILCERFDSAIAPFAVQIVQRLVDQCATLVRAPAEDDEAAMAALQCVRGINTILYAVESQPELITQLEPLVQPLIAASFHEDAMDLFEDILVMISVLSYLRPGGPSQFMWSCVPQIITAYQTWASDFLPHIMSPIDNFIGCGTQVFASEQQPYLQLVLTTLCIPPLTQTETDIAVTDACYAAKLLCAILAHCKGLIDRVVPQICQMCATLLIKLQTARDEQLAAAKARRAKALAARLKGKKSKAKKGKKAKSAAEDAEAEDDDSEDQTLQLRRLLVDVMSGCAYYDPRLFLSSLFASQPSPQFLERALNVWLSYAQASADGSFAHQKIAALGMSALLTVDAQNMPPLVLDAMPHIINLSIETLVTLKVAYDEEEANEAQQGEDGEEQEDSDDDYDDRVFLEEDAAIDSSDDIAIGGGEAMGSASDIDDDEPAGGDDDQDSKMAQLMQIMAQHELDEVDESSFESPIDEVCEFAFFAQAAERFAALSKPQWEQYLHLTSSSKEESLRNKGAQFQSLIVEAQTRAQKAKEEEAKQAAEAAATSAASQQQQSIGVS